MESSNSNNFLCFFCTTCSEYTEKGNKSENPSNHHHLTFQNISRYLGKSKLFSDLNETSSSLLSSWFVCNDCSQMADKFNELYHLLEVTKLELNWYLDKMHGVMAMTKENQSPYNLANENKDNNIFRADVLDGIKEITSQRLPRVALCKIETPPQKEEKREFNEYHCHSSGLSDEMDLDEPMDSQCQSPVTVTVENEKIKKEYDFSIKREPGIELLGNSGGKGKEKNEIQRVPAKLPCSFCRAQFLKHPSQGDIMLRQHEAQYHCDQLFPNHKLDSVTSSEFKKILGSLIWKELINENEDTTCIFCSKKFKNSKNDRTRLRYISKLKMHFITTHYEKLEKKLEEFQKNPNLSRILRDCESVGELCECGVYLQNFASRKAHVKWHCPLTAKEKQEQSRKFSKAAYKEEFLSSVFSPVPKSSSSLIKARLSCKLCKETFVSRGHAIRHWNYYCKKGKKLSLPTGESMTCEYKNCGYQCANHAWTAKSKMKYHYLRCHPEHYFKSEWEQQQQSLSTWKENNFRIIIVRTLFPEFVIWEGKTVKCSLCETKYNNARCSNNLLMLKTHQINNHKDVLRQKLKVILNESDASLREKLKVNPNIP